MEKRSSWRLPPAHGAKSEGALSNDGYKSSNFYRTMDKHAGLHLGGHLPAGGNRRRLAHPRIPESSSRSGCDGEHIHTGCRECRRWRPKPDPGSVATNGRHPSWTIARKTQVGPE